MRKPVPAMRVARLPVCDDVPLPSPGSHSPEGALAHSAELRRELGVRDLVLAQIVIIVGNSWIGTAGKLGPANLAYWVPAAALFFVPTVAVVLFLNRWVSLEGGLYQWAKLAFGPGIGFLVAFNLALTSIAFGASLGVEVVQALAYAFGSLGWMRSDPRAAPIATVVILAGIAAASIAGMRIGKGVHNAGGATRILMYAILIVLPLSALLLGHPLRAEAARIEVPPVTLLGVNLLAKMGFGALSGFEYVAIFAGESRDSEKTMARSLWWAGPIVLAMYVLGTGALLAYVAPADIDLIQPLPQALARGTAGFGMVSRLASFVVLLAVVGTIANGSAMVAGTTRLPMVAGWDGILPAWFMRLSPRSRVPVNSILVVSGITIALALWGLTGVGHQEAYQLFVTAGLAGWALTYLVMFAIPIVGRGPGLPRPPLWLRLAAACGFAMTALFLALSVFPIVDVEDATSFGLRVTGVVVGTNLLGAAVYFAGKRRMGAVRT